MNVTPSTSGETGPSTVWTFGPAAGAAVDVWAAATLGVVKTSSPSDATVAATAADFWRKSRLVILRDVSTQKHMALSFLLPRHRGESRRSAGADERVATSSRRRRQQSGPPSLGCQAPALSSAW